MAFLESPTFPEDISYGSSGGPKYNTTVVTLSSGFEQRNANWTYPLHEFDVQYGIKDIVDLETVISFFHVVQGAYKGFRYKDWLDCNSTNFGNAGTTTFSDQNIGTGDGNNKVFQLRKVYTQGSNTLVRNIVKIKSGSVLIGVNGTPQNSGWSVNNDTGVVTFTNAPGNGLAVTAGFAFYVPVRFLDDTLSVNITDLNVGSSQIKLTEIRL